MVPISFVMVPPTIVSLTTDSGGDRRDSLEFASWLMGCTWAQTRAATYQCLLIVHYRRPSPSFSAIHRTCSPLHIPMYVYSCYMACIAVYGRISTRTIPYGRVEISLTVRDHTCTDPSRYGHKPVMVRFAALCHPLFLLLHFSPCRNLLSLMLATAALAT